MATQPHILFVLDNPKDEQQLSESLGSTFKLEFCFDPGQTLELIERSKPKAVVLCFQGDLISPLAIAHILRKDPHADYIGLIYISQQESNEWLERALSAGVDICLPEGRTMLQTTAAIESVLRLCAIKHEVQQMNAKMHNAYQKLKSLSFTDDLTGFGNHHFLTNQLRIEFKRAQRYQKNLVLLIVRIDSFKGMDDLSSTQESTLSKIGQTIGSSVRFEIDYTGRSREAEFFVILPETELDGAISVAERIRKKIAKLHGSSEHGHLATSIGLAHFDGDRGNFEDFQDFLNTAYLAVHAAEEHGGDQYYALDSSAEETPEERSA
jgi:diguanylate cyclase (GGDEF)-like protein